MLNNKLYTPIIVLFLAFILTSCSGRGPNQPPATINRSQLGKEAINTQSVPLNAGQLSAPSTADAHNMAELQAKIGAVTPDGDGSVTISISDDELTQVLRTLQTAAAQQGRPSAITNPTIVFTNGQIIFTGQVTTEQFSGHLEVVFTAYVTNNTLQIEVVSASLDGRNVPPPILQTAEQTLNTALAQAMSQLPPTVSLDSVTVQEDELIITGSVNR